MQVFREHLEQIISIDDAEFADILSYFEPISFRKNDFVLREGNKVDHEYFVVSGLLKSYLTDADGKDHILQFAWENWWISDYDAFWKQGFSSLNIDCIEDVELLRLSLDRKMELFTRFRKMEQFFLRKSNNGYVALQKRVLSLLTNSAEKRFEQLIATYPKLMQRVPKKLIAAYLGVSRETLSRLSAK